MKEIIIGHNNGSPEPRLIAFADNEKQLHDVWNALVVRGQQGSLDWCEWHVLGKPEERAVEKIVQRTTMAAPNGAREAREKKEL